jgi:uncharacterized protein YjdB
VSRITASFITVVTQAGRSVDVPFTAYRTPGTREGKAKVTWTASSPKVASVTKGRKAGTLAVTPGAVHKLTVNAAKTGLSRIVLSAPGVGKYVITVKVVPVGKLRQVSKVAITAKPGRAAAAKTNPFVLTPGEGLQLKARIAPAQAARTAATWESSNPSVATVNAVGRVKAVGAGTTVITCTVSGVTTHKKLRVA